MEQPPSFQKKPEAFPAIVRFLSPTSSIKKVYCVTIRAPKENPTMKRRTQLRITESANAEPKEVEAFKNKRKEKKRNLIK
jgi:hypothetical protein